jgi:hypothetical protein
LESSPGSKKGGRSKKGAYLRSLLDNENLRESFDDLLPINGLWDGMNIGVLHKLMAMKTEEVILQNFDTQTYVMVRQLTLIKPSQLSVI